MSTAVVNLDSTIARRIGPPPLFSAVTSWNGLTGAVKGTLAEIWAFGATDSALLDNLFAMPSGNLRFVGSTGTGQLPASGFFESATTQGDPRVAVDYFARYFNVGVGVGGTSFDQYDGFNPTWDGTFRGIGGLQTFANRAGFSNGSGPQTGPTSGLTLARQTYWNIFGFFDGTDYWPLLNSNDGGREDVKWDLYNERDGLVDCGRLTGWGTWIGRPLLLNHGTTAAFDTQARFGISGGTAADDGVGWFVRSGTDDPPLGIARWFWQGNGSASGWEFLASNTPGTLQSLLKMDPIAGAVFGVPVTFPPTSNGVIVGPFKSPVFDMTVLGGPYDVALPVVAGKTFNLAQARLELVTKTGTATVQGATRYLQDGAQFPAPNGNFDTGLGISTVNNLSAPCQTGNGIGQALPPINTTLAHPLQVSVITAMGGVTALTVQVAVFGWFE